MDKFILSAFSDEIALDLETQMNVLDEYGIKYIEMRKVEGKVIVEYPIDRVNEIKKQLDDRGFKISAVGSPIGKYNIEDDFAPHLELFKHTVQIANILETNYIRMFSFYIPEGSSLSIYRDEVIKRLSEFVRIAEKEGITLLHENERNLYGESPQGCLDIHSTINSPFFRAIFDPANYVQCGYKTYPEAYLMLKDYIVYMHIKDAVAAGDRHVVPSGYGDGKVEEILTDLYKSGFEGFLSIEPHLKNFEGFAELAPESEINNMPEGWPKKFAMAYFGLEKVLSILKKNVASKE